ncbi:hypothetical protein Y032_0002g1086 [Ancylostoma ceylanicum]|uniref:Uncharacterized protein n=1 Tax=Ancylostoma ceylanicum TaxID=53326 RepID=A0A016VZK2_9BILA|nr:hypothetical protein Y032_0002g1086 [Ancylostoma ceylanicum]
MGVTPTVTFISSHDMGLFNTWLPLKAHIYLVEAAGSSDSCGIFEDTELRCASDTANSSIRQESSKQFEIGDGRNNVSNIFSVPTIG